MQIEFKPEWVQLAADWHSGQASMLYAIASTGSLSLGTDRPYDDEGTSLSDTQWLLSLAIAAKAEFNDVFNDIDDKLSNCYTSEKTEDEDELEEQFRACQFVRIYLHEKIRELRYQIYCPKFIRLFEDLQSASIDYDTALAKILELISDSELSVYSFQKELRRQGLIFD